MEWPSCGYSSSDSLLQKERNGLNERILDYVFPLIRAQEQIMNLPPMLTALNRIGETLILKLFDQSDIENNRVLAQHHSPRHGFHSPLIWPLKCLTYSINRGAQFDVTPTTLSSARHCRSSMPGFFRYRGDSWPSQHRTISTPQNSPCTPQYTCMMLTHRGSSCTCLN
jgi:hypothetical protein